MTVIHVLVIGLGGFLVAMAQEIGDGADERQAAQFMGAVYAASGLIFCVVFGIGLALPRKSWGWIYGIVLICFGFMSCCTMLPCIFLIIHWVKPETKQYFSSG